MYSKKEQTAWNKQTSITKKEKDYLEWFAHQSLSCIVCGSYNMIEGHHIKERSTDQKNHFQMIPLCKEHHTGNKISPHGAKAKFFDMFPIEAQRTIAFIIYNHFLGEQF